MAQVFTPSATETTTIRPSDAPATFAMPAVDGANPCTAITNVNGGTPAFLAFGSGRLLVGPEVGGNAITVEPGQTVLLGSNHPAATATVVTAQLASRGDVAITRGSVASVTIFDNSGRLIA
jgi:hypothetical protein